MHSWKMFLVYQYFLDFGFQCLVRHISKAISTFHFLSNIPIWKPSKKLAIDLLFWKLSVASSRRQYQSIWRVHLDKSTIVNLNKLQKYLWWVYGIIFSINLSSRLQEVEFLLDQDYSHDFCSFTNSFSESRLNPQDWCLFTGFFSFLFRLVIE